MATATHEYSNGWSCLLKGFGGKIAGREHSSREASCKTIQHMIFTYKSMSTTYSRLTVHSVSP